MKKILIFTQAMELGGAERALLGLLENIDTQKYQVDLFLMKHSGELLEFIPDKINLLPEIPQYSCMAVPFKEVLRKKQYRVGVERAVGKIKARNQVKKLRLSADNNVALEVSHKCTLKAMPEISKTRYDLAISFLTPHYYVTEKVHADKKIAWIHTDYSVIDVDVNEELKMWSAYDKIVSISEAVTDAFLTKFPTLKDKICVIENMMAADSIMKQSEADIETEMIKDDTLSILSIGRFCTAKNFDNVPDICSKIIQKGCNVRWYLIGYGGSEELIRSKIEEAGMRDRVVILGKKENPYPYIKKCDVYIQPSRYEGNSVSVREAQFFGKPVIITDYATSKSQLQDDVDGVIVPMDNDECAAQITNILKDKDRLDKLSANTRLFDYTNKNEIEKLYDIVEK